jgi:ParB-like chromosome segregation protein Spo0J
VISDTAIKVEVWPTDKAIPYDKNPRAISDKAIAKVAASIREFGFQQPLVVDTAGVIIVGHTRLKAAQSLGLATVPVVVADLPAEKARAYRLADNRTHEEATWLDDLLSGELKALDALDFDLSLTGFDDRELLALLSDEAELERAEETPAVPAIPVTITGDVWIMGKHRVVCGDSTKADDVAKALNGVEPHLMVTDPPYGVEYDPAWRGEAKSKDGRRVSLGVHAKGTVENDDRADWREAWALFPGDVAYVWHAGLFAGTVAESLEAVGFALRSQIVWAKNNFAIGRGDYHWKHEPCWYAVKGTGHWSGDRTQSTLWDIPKPQKSETGHGTQKPVECMRRPIVNNSSPGQAVYEPFSGSGTTIIAAEMTGRACHAIELNPAYVDVAVKRWQEFAGGQATLEGDGRTFDAIAAARIRKTDDAGTKANPRAQAEAVA